MKKFKLIFCVVVAMVPVLLSGSCNKLKLEHEEARHVEIMKIDFTTLKDGDYQGYYEGGMFKWRENTCKVSIKLNKVTTIELLKSKAAYKQEFLKELYKRVIEKQSLQVDAISGSTLDSKACLKAVEDALLKASP
jgi:uncharacterized protein with FMN-binding domain